MKRSAPFRCFGGCEHTAELKTALKAIIVDNVQQNRCPGPGPGVGALSSAGIQLELLDYPAKDSRQGKPAEDKIITGSRKAQVLLTVGNPLITRKVLVALPKAKFVQWFGPGPSIVSICQ